MSFTFGNLNTFVDEQSFSLISKAVLTTDLMGKISVRANLSAGTVAVNLMDGDLNVGNRLDEPITVVLRLASPRLSFPDGDQTITLPPESTQTIQVPVRARSNGTSSVEVDILTPSGDPLIETVTLKSRVNSLTGLGQALTAGLVLILLTWWFSHWRRRRRAENAAADPA